VEGKGRDPCSGLSGGCTEWCWEVEGGWDFDEGVGGLGELS
jgi:hypothetical protein